MRRRFKIGDNDERLIAMKITSNRQLQILHQMELIDQSRLMKHEELWVIIFSNYVVLVKLSLAYNLDKKPRNTIEYLWSKDLLYNVFDKPNHELVETVLSKIHNGEDCLNCNIGTVIVEDEIVELTLRIIQRILESINGEEDIDADAINQALIKLGMEPLAKWHINYLTKGASFEAQLANDGTTEKVKISLSEYLYPLQKQKSGELD